LQQENWPSGRQPRRISKNSFNAGDKFVNYCIEELSKEANADKTELQLNPSLDA